MSTITLQTLIQYLYESLFNTNARLTNSHTRSVSPINIDTLLIIVSKSTILFQ